MSQVKFNICTADPCRSKRNCSLTHMKEFDLRSALRKKRKSRSRRSLGTEGLLDALLDDGGLSEHVKFVDVLLSNVANNCKHSKAAVLELLKLVVALHSLGLALGEAEGVEAEVARLAVLPLLHLVEHLGLNERGEGEDTHEEEGVDALETAVDKGRRLLALGEEVGEAELARQIGLELLRCGPANGGKHSKAAVLDLGLAEGVELIEGLGKVEGIEALVAHHDAVGKNGILAEEVEVDRLAHIGVATSVLTIHLHVHQTLILAVVDNAIAVEVSALDKVTHGGIGGELHDILKLVKVDGARVVRVDLLEELGRQESLLDERACGLDLHVETAHGRAVGRAGETRAAHGREGRRAGEGSCKSHRLERGGHCVLGNGGQTLCSCYFQGLFAATPM